MGLSLVIRPSMSPPQGGIKEGEGKYTWPTGAVYRGDWHDGCMHGHGTLQGPDGSVYTGACHVKVSNEQGVVDVGVPGAMCCPHEQVAGRRTRSTA
jgi:MORN repeat